MAGLHRSGEKPVVQGRLVRSLMAQTNLYVPSKVVWDAAEAEYRLLRTKYYHPLKYPAYPFLAPVQTGVTSGILTTQPGHSAHTLSPGQGKGDFLGR